MRKSTFLGVLAVFVGFLFMYAGTEVFGVTLPVRVIRFNDVKPAGAVITSTFEGIGFDPSGKVFTTLCDATETIAGRGNCFVFSWDPVTGNKKYYDNFLDAADRVDNLGPNADWPNRETLVKGHTHLQYMNNQLWMGSMNAHGYEPDSMPKHRGVHLFALNLATGKLVDHGQWQPKGVFHERGGTYTVEVVPDKNLVLSIGVPNCTIIKYNPTTHAVTKTPGAPHEDNPQLSGRDMVLLAGDKLLYQCGSGPTPFGLYDVNTNATEVLDFHVGNPVSLAYAKTSDGQTVYINDGKDIYRFSLASKSGVKITSLAPDGGNNQTSPINLSPDEKKLYYTINQAGGDGGPAVMDLYEYNLETGVRTKLMNLRSIVGESAKLSGAHAMRSNWKLYQVFNGATAGVIEIDLNSRKGSESTVVATPTATPAGGAFTTTQTFTLSTLTPGATIRYTTDGSMPTETSTAYTGAITISETTSYKVRAFKTGLTTSGLLAFTFTKTGSSAGCLKFPSNSTPPAGYGASWDVTSAAKELMVFSNCPTTGNSLNIAVGKGEVTQYIWSTMYVYGGTSWTAYTLAGTPGGDGWLLGAGEKTVTMPFTPTSANPLYYVGYTCVPSGSTWKCGCANASCTSKHWQLQGYTGM